MLKHTFIPVPGVGPKTELKLWEKGILSWEDYVTDSGQLGLNRRGQLNSDKYIRWSLEALRCGDALFFEQLLPKREIWRIYPELYAIGFGVQIYKNERFNK